MPLACSPRPRRPGQRTVPLACYVVALCTCRVDRSGCRDFGFVLDDSLATWPPHFYRDWLRQRIPTGALTLSVTGPADRATAAEQAMADYLRVFGSEVKRVDEAPSAAEGAVVRHRHPSDALMARAVAAALGEAVEVAPGATKADIEVVLPTE